MKLGTMLADCAMRYPDREAMVCGDRRVTFAELDTRASRLANALLAEGQAFGDRVALYLPNGAELVEAMAAVARSGGVIVPISTRLTTAEVRYIFDDCEPAFVFFAPEFREPAYEAADGLDGVRMVAVAEPATGELGFERLIAAGSPAAPPALPVDKDDLVIGYTSGTTGNPKGAVNTHRNLISVNGFMNSIEWGLERTDRTLVTTPMAHRTGLGRVTNMLCLGSSLVILPRCPISGSTASTPRRSPGSLPASARRNSSIMGHRAAARCRGLSSASSTAISKTSPTARPARCWCAAASRARS